MSKTLSYSDNVSGSGWIPRTTYSTDDIRKIHDTNGGMAEFPRTAIPSPFAQIDLVANAFATLAAENLNSARAHCRLVSNALDIAQILFDFPNHSNRIRIIRWNPATQIARMIESPGHRLLGETLKLFFNSDGPAYNFNDRQDWYILSTDNIVIGSTSPASFTMAAPAVGEMPGISVEEGEVLFGHNTRQLWERDRDFVVWLVHYFNAFPELRAKLRCVYDYILVNLEIARVKRPDLYHKVTERVHNPAALSADNAPALAESMRQIYSGFECAEQPRIFDLPIYTRRTADMLGYVRQSDFLLCPLKDPDKSEQTPLLLRNGFVAPGLEKFTYINREWKDSTIVLTDGLPPESRILPDSSLKYPWLTTCDFLEETLLELAMPVDNRHFFDGNPVQVSNDTGFILPIKPLFFKYFPASYLTASVVPGKKVFEIRDYGDSVNVTLRLPVKKGFVELDRTYRRIADGNWKYDELNNEGSIIPTLPLSVGIFPFVRTGRNDIYNVQMLELLHDFKGTLSFHSDNNGRLELHKEPHTRSRFRVGTSSYYEVDSSFDHIAVSLSTPDGRSHYSGIILPLWPEYHASTSEFRFAVDFGTTNTHIEYSIDRQPATPLTFTESNGATLMATLARPGSLAQFESVNELEFIPRSIDGFFSFPTRTAIAENEDNSAFPEALMSTNISFTYERKEFSRYKVSTSLKWADNTILAEQYLRELMMLIRARILISKGNPANSQVLYFYPVSMKKSLRNRFLSLWEGLCSKYLPESKDISIVSLPESIAPAFYYKDSSRDGSDFASIDIGGGTTDVVVYRGDAQTMRSNLCLISSFRFAGNSIFGDGFEHSDADNNPLVNEYAAYFSKTVADNSSLSYLDVILSNIIRSKRSEDVNAFLFSIENSEPLRNLSPLDRRRYSYNALLADDSPRKIIFLYFFTAIIYYVANMMKDAGIGMPKHLYFSGTGSKILNIVGRHDSVEQLARDIIERVYDKNYGNVRFSLKLEQECPKQITCKGGLELLDDRSRNEESARIFSSDIVTLHKKTFTMTEDAGHTYASIRSPQARRQIEDAVRRFNRFFIDLLDTGRRNEFGIEQNVMEMFATNADSDIANYLSAGINAFLPIDEGSDEPVEDVAFFYPLTGIIRNTLIPMLGHTSNKTLP